MSKNQIHYDISNIEKENAHFNIIYGEKSNGKSYQVKHKVIRKYLNLGRRFILLRRWAEDLRNDWIESYFSDVDVSGLTNGKYNTISVYRKAIYLSNYDEEKSKILRGEKIGYAIALSTEQHYSGASYLDVDDIIFEEFMERGGVYIRNESSRLITFYSTVDRKRGTTQVWLVGNTISRICPYIEDWGLQHIMRNQKQGTIETLIIKNEENDVKIAVEYCRASGGKTMAIGTAKGMIDKGAWQSFPQPHLPKSKSEYRIIYRVGFFYKSFKFIGELLRDNNDLCWFIYPYYKEFNTNMLVFSDIIKPSRLWQKDIYNITIKNDKLQKILYTFRESQIFYSTDLDGTDFKSAIDFPIRK